MSNFEKNMGPIIAKEDIGNKLSSEEMKAPQDQDKEPIANKEGVEMKKYVFKMDEKVIEAIKQQRTESRIANKIANYKDEEHRRLLSRFRGEYVPPRGHAIFYTGIPGVSTMSREDREEKEKNLSFFRKNAEGIVFEKTGDDYWHTEYRAEICNEAGESEVVRIVRHVVAAAMDSFTAYDIFLGNKRINIDEFDWDELTGQMK